MTQTQTPDEQGYLSHGQILVVMSGLMAGMFLAALDQSIVGTALPRITSELGGLSQLSWVVTAYLLTQTASTPLWGKISDLYGRKLIFQAAIITFLVGSLMSGLAQNIGELIASVPSRASVAVACSPSPSPPSATSSRRVSVVVTAATSVRSSARPACWVRCWVASSPTVPAGAGSSSSTSRSASPRW